MIFLYYDSGYPRKLHSFPTRRSSDLGEIRDCYNRGNIKVDSQIAGGISGYIHYYTGGTVGYTRIMNTYSTGDRKSTRLNSSHVSISYAVFCLKKKTTKKKKKCS